MDRTPEIVEMIEREQRAFKTEDVDLLLSVYHPDMVWVWPPHNRAYDPMEWILRMGRYDKIRWRELIELYFSTHKLVHDRKEIRKIVLSKEQDGAFAVIDSDTKWIRVGGDSPWHDGTNEEHLVGRACKIYSLVNGEWKLYFHPGTMHFPVGT